MVQSLDSRDQLASAVNPHDNSYVPRLMNIYVGGIPFP